MNGVSDVDVKRAVVAWISQTSILADSDAKGPGPWEQYLGEGQGGRCTNRDLRRSASPRRQSSSPLTTKSPGRLRALPRRGDGPACA
jgi:hypothetical protein